MQMLYSYNYVVKFHARDNEFKHSELSVKSDLTAINKQTKSLSSDIRNLPNTVIYLSLLFFHRLQGLWGQDLLAKTIYQLQACSI